MSLASPYFQIQNLPQGVKKIIFTRPKVKNAFDQQMILELKTCFESLIEIKQQNDLRLVILTGEDQMFCAGADLNYMREQSHKSFEENSHDANLLGKMFFALASIPCPVISAVKGAAIGGGLGLCACSDFVLAENKAIFATSEVKLGLVPAVISPYIIRKIGVSSASHLMLTGSKIDTQQAHKIGLVNQITSPEQYELNLENLIESFLTAGPNAARMTKKLIHAISPLPDQKTFDDTVKTIALARSSDEGQEGLNSFFEKKKASWCPRTTDKM